MNTEELKRLAEAATPGPWEYQKDSKDFPVKGYVIVPDCIYSVCVLPYEGIRTDDRVTDNGLFIAAANPAAILELIRQRDELLAALKACRKELSAWMRHHGEDIATQEAVAQARAVIAKVEV